MVQGLRYATEAISPAHLQLLFWPIATAMYFYGVANGVYENGVVRFTKTDSTGVTEKIGSIREIFPEFYKAAVTGTCGDVLL